MPFSYGERACIGQPLTLIIMRSVLAAAVRKFHLTVDASTDLKVTEALFYKPRGIQLKLFPRSQCIPPTSFSPAPSSEQSSVGIVGKVEGLVGKRLVVLFGSNMGTCEDYA